jgi:amino acid transporter
VARLFCYGATCAALIVFRKRPPAEAMFRLHGGLIIATLGVVICVGLLTQVDLNQSVILLATLAIAFLNWLLVKNSPDSRK